MYALGGTPTLLLSTMGSQLEAVRQDIRSVKDELVEIKQDLAAAKKAKNAQQERKLFDLLLCLNNQLSGLQEEKNILLRGQAPGKPCLQLVHTGLPVIILRSIQWKKRTGLYQLWMNYIPIIIYIPSTWILILVQASVAPQHVKSPNLTGSTGTPSVNDSVLVLGAACTHDPTGILPRLSHRWTKKTFAF